VAPHVKSRLKLRGIHMVDMARPSDGNAIQPPVGRGHLRPAERDLSRPPEKRAPEAPFEERDPWVSPRPCQEGGVDSFRTIRRVVFVASLG
jgi:hypothetical protein